VFQNGIVVLGVVSSLLIVVFRGEVDALIPLYVIKPKVVVSNVRYHLRWT
jgi:hypothetical protein